MTESDTNGDGVFDQTRTDVTVLNPDGSRTETVTRLVAGTIVGRTVTTTSASGLSVTTETDPTGGGVAETRTDVTVLNADGSRTETVSDRSASGGLLERTVTTTSANGESVSVSRDVNGDGIVDQTEAVTVGLDGSRTDVVSDLNSDGSLKDKVVTTTSANGLSTTIQRDATGSGSFAQIDTDVTVHNADGSEVETTTSRNADGSLRQREVTTTSADGLSKTIQWDDAGSGSFDRTATDVTVVNANGSKTDTVTNLNADGTTHDQTVTASSADGRTVTVQWTIGGVSSTELKEVNADGSVTTTDSDFNGDGSLRDRLVTTVSADGLSTTIQRDTKGTRSFDQTETDVTLLNADGSRVETGSSFNADGSLQSRAVITTSADDLSKTTQYDLTGSAALRRHRPT